MAILTKLSANLNQTKNPQLDWIGFALDWICIGLDSHKIRMGYPPPGFKPGRLEMTRPGRGNLTVFTNLQNSEDSEQLSILRSVV